MEAWLGVTLFDRSARNISLNSAGGNYLKTISSALDLIAQGSENLQHLKPENTLGIATTHSIASKWLMDKLSVYSQVSNETEVWLSLEQRSTDFDATGIDLAIRMGHGPWPDLYCLPLLRDRLIPVCSAKLLSNNKPLKQPSDLANLTLLHDRDPDAQWQSWCKANNVELKNIAKGPRFTSSDILLNSAINSQGVALVSEVWAATDLAQQRLVQPLSQVVELGVYFWLVMPKENYQQPQVRRFCDWLLASVEDGATVLQAF